MKVKQLIKELQKLDPEAKIGTFASEAFDFSLTPIAEVFEESGVELHEDFRGRGKKRFEDWIVLVGMHQKWRPHYRHPKEPAPSPRVEKKEE